MHGYTHTLGGALVIGLVAGVIGRPISTFALGLLKIPHYSFTWTASFAGALVGTCSHVLFDAAMHPDMRPWWPLTEGNGLLAIIPAGMLHILCLGLGVVGAAVLAAKARWQGKL